jgi:hypothetical protein
MHSSLKDPEICGNKKSKPKPMNWYKVNYTQQHNYDFPKNLTTWRDSNPGLLSVPDTLYHVFFQRIFLEFYRMFYVCARSNDHTCLQCDQTLGEKRTQCCKKIAQNGALLYIFFSQRNY